MYGKSSMDGPLSQYKLSCSIYAWYTRRQNGNFHFKGTIQTCVVFLDQCGPPSRPPPSGSKGRHARLAVSMSSHLLTLCAIFVSTTSYQMRVSNVKQLPHV